MSEVLEEEIVEEATAPAEEAEPSYTFDDLFQRKIAALVVRDTLFTQKTDGLIKPEYFERDADAAIVGLVLDYFNTYKRAPSPSTMGPLMKTAVLTKRIRKDLVPDIRDRLKEIFKTDLSDAEFIADQVSAFAKHRAMEKAILESVGALERKDYSAIEKMMRSALDVGMTDDSHAYNYWEEIESRTAHRVAVAAGLIKPDGISTGSAELDSYLYHHGWGRKELSVLMGAAKAGKSMSLAEFGKAACMLGFNVFYATLENSARITADRMDANIASEAIRLLKDKPHSIREKIEKAHLKSGRMDIREYATGTMKVSDLRRVLEKERGKGHTYDLIIVDYADLCAPEHRSTDGLRFDLRDIYIDLRAVGFIYNAAVLTATQTNRTGAKAAIAKMTDVSEDFSKAMTADLIISINALDAEIASGEARLFFAAHRNGESGFTLRIKQEREKMKFLTKVLGKE